MKLTTASIPKGDQDLVQLFFAAGQLFSLFLSDIITQKENNPEGYIKIEDRFTHWLMIPKGEEVYKKKSFIKLTSC